MMSRDRSLSVDGLMAMLADCEDVWDTPDRSGDPVDILDHGLQVAAVLAERYPQDEELQVAGLVHDIGHYLVPGDEAEHGEHAAAAVSGLLGPRVARLVALHIPAKRYLAAADPECAAGLSPESMRTLALQGGPMTPQEQNAFEAAPDFPAAVALRRADDAGKVVGLRVAGLEHWRPRVERVAASHAGTFAP
ncbi:HD domain-containing protein [Streptomyces lunaelactis]|nr:HD domain-containing protein [Streptomyces lunaelactis]NUK58533.1 HD domain-containing protein [Streptomyces lunaelactis]NUL10892.1 HD domain-containing protein [Streptomyces lunaelactis]NUL23571.1 HD domain-containing protein [Streptomyces lunaelactis]